MRNFVSKSKSSKQLISHDAKNNSYNYKHTFILELAPICRDDLVILPRKVSKDLGGIGPLVIVYKISTFVHIVDIHTMETFEIDQVTYWKNEFNAVCSRERLSEFIVLSVEDTDVDCNVSRAAARQKFKLVTV